MTTSKVDPCASHLMSCIVPREFGTAQRSQTAIGREKQTGTRRWNGLPVYTVYMTKTCASLGLSIFVTRKVQMEKKKHITTRSHLQVADPCVDVGSQPMWRNGI